VGLPNPKSKPKGITDCWVSKGAVKTVLMVGKTSALGSQVMTGKPCTRQAQKWGMISGGGGAVTSSGISW